MTSPPELPARTAQPRRETQRHRLVALLFLASACDPTPSSPPPAGPTPAPTASATSQSVLDAPLEPPREGDRAAAGTWFQQALAARSAQRLHDAVLAFARAVTADPSHLESRIEYGFQLIEPTEDQSLGVALEQFRIARLMESDHLHAIAGEGIVRAQLNDWARAEPLLRRALAELPPTAVGRRALCDIALADLLAGDGRPEEALQHYDAASGESRPPTQRTGALVRSAAVLMQLDRPEEAEPRLRRALQIEMEHVRAHYLLAQLLSRRAKDDATRAEAAREARIHELLRALRDHLSSLYVRDTARRAKLWNELAEAWPENKRLLHSLVRDQLDGNDFAGARITVERLEARDGRTAETLWLGARATAGSGDLVGAKALVEAMLKLDANVPPQVVRAVLEDWRRGNSATVDQATFERTVKQWLGNR